MRLSSAGTAAHGIELDDGYGTAQPHCGCVVIPTVLAVGYDRHVSGRALIEAVVAGYETNICLARRLRAGPAPTRLFIRPARSGPSAPRWRQANCAG